jgi:hypothetical protein
MKDKIRTATDSVIYLRSALRAALSALLYRPLVAIDLVLPPDDFSSAARREIKRPAEVLWRDQEDRHRGMLIGQMTGRKHFYRPAALAANFKNRDGEEVRDAPFDIDAGMWVDRGNDGCCSRRRVAWAWIE